MPPSTLPACALYLRVSTTGQRERHTIDSQRRLLPEVAARHGLTVVETYVDDGVSGETIEARPAFRRLLDDASAGKFQAVCVVDFDRLTRATDLAQLALIKRIFRDNGISVITPGQVFDLKDEDHDFLSDLFGILAKHEKRKIVARIRRGIQEKRLQGQWVMGRPPIPYVRRNGRLTVEPGARRRVLAALWAVHRGEPVGRGWGRGAIRRLLARRRLLFYAGVLEVGRRQITGAWPTLLTVAEAEALLARRPRPHRAPPPTQRFAYLLTGLGLFRCARCGRAMGSHLNSAYRPPRGRSQPVRWYRRGYYRCNNRVCPLGRRVIAADRVDRTVVERLSRQMQRLRLLRRFAKTVTASRTSAQAMERVEAAVAEAQARRTRLLDAISRGVVRLGEAQETLDAIRQEIVTAEAERTRVQAEAQGGLTEADLARMEQVALADVPVADQRQVIRACVERVTWDGERVRIAYRFFLDGSGRRQEAIRLDGRPWRSGSAPGSQPGRRGFDPRRPLQTGVSRVHW